MLKTKIFALSGLILIAYPFLLGGEALGYQRSIWMLQMGIVSLGLGMFFRLMGTKDKQVYLTKLYDLES